MKNQRHYFLLTFLFFIMIVAGCGSSGSDSGSHSSSNGGSPPATDNEPAEDQKIAKIVFTEIMYHPGDDSPEFLELSNNGDETVDLSGYTFSKGIEYTFKNDTIVDPGEIIVLSDVDPDDPDDADLYELLIDRLPDHVQLFTPYSGQLKDGGEEIELRNPYGKKVCDITFGDESPWPIAADGFGYSMVVADPTLATWSNAAQDWLASARINGSPGTLDATDAMPDMKVRVNEVLAHTDSGGGDAIELYNAGENPVDISGWYLTDDKTDYEKFQIPDGTVIEPNKYLVLYEIYDATNSDNIDKFLFGDEFQLSAHGEEIFLFAVDNGILSGYAHGFSFGEIENNISIGSYVNASGQIQFIAQKAESLGDKNEGPYVGQIVISEIMYHADGTIAPCNFVEIANTGNNETTLFDNDHPENTWEISGIDFSFPDTVRIQSDERIVLIEQEPLSIADFRQYYNLGNDVQIYKFNDTLKANRQTLEVMKPEDPLEDGTVPHMVVDRAGYDEDNTGLEDADGSGVSLERINLHAYGDDYTNWELSIPGGTPGS